jgi:hypothetical protein
VGANDSGINRQPLEVGIVGNPFQDPIKDPFPDPSVVTLLRGFIGAKSLGKIPPTGAGTSQPKERVKEQSRVASWPTAAFHTPGNIGFQTFPLIVA